MAILSLETYKTNAGITSPNKDAVLQPLIDMVNNYIPRYCNSNFEPVVLTGEKPLSVCGSTIILEHAPVISVEVLATISDFLEPGVPIDPESFYLDKQEGVITILNPILAIPQSRFSFSIDYTAGWAVPPPDVTAAAEELVRHYEKREFTKHKDMGNGQEVTYFGTSIIPLQVRAILDTYRVL